MTYAVDCLNGPMHSPGPGQQQTIKLVLGTGYDLEWSGTTSNSFAFGNWILESFFLFC